MMGKRRRLLVVAILGLLVLGGVAAQGTERSSGSIGVGEILLTVEDHALSTEIVRGFVATGSDSGTCLTSLHETNFADAATTVFCGVRLLNGVSGIMVTIHTGDPMPPDAAWTVGVYQEHAKAYPNPIFSPSP